MKKNPYKKRTKDLEDHLRDVRDEITEVLGDADDDDESADEER